MDQQSRQQVLKAYCSNVYTVKIGIGAVILFSMIWNFPKCFQYSFWITPKNEISHKEGYLLSEWLILLRYVSIKIQHEVWNSSLRLCPKIVQKSRVQITAWAGRIFCPVLTHSWDLLSNLFSPILQFSFSKFWGQNSLPFFFPFLNSSYKIDLFWYLTLQLKNYWKQAFSLFSPHPYSIFYTPS